MPDMKALVEYMAKSIVNNPEAVTVDEINTRRGIVYKLGVDSQDMGRVIGKSGRMANSMRVLLRVAAVKAGHDDVSLEIRE